MKFTRIIVDRDEANTKAVESMKAVVLVHDHAVLILVSSDGHSAEKV